MEKYNTTIIFKELPDEFADVSKKAVKKPRKQYEVVGTFPSSSKPSKSYTVKIDPDTEEYTCDCPSWKFNQRKDRTCKHTDLLIGNKRQRQQNKLSTLQPKEVLKTVNDETVSELTKKKRKMRF